MQFNSSKCVPPFCPAPKSVSCSYLHCLSLNIQVDAFLLSVMYLVPFAHRQSLPLHNQEIDNSHDYAISRPAHNASLSLPVLSGGFDGYMGLPTISYKIVESPLDFQFICPCFPPSPPVNVAVPQKVAESRMSS